MNLLTNIRGSGCHEDIQTCEITNSTMTTVKSLLTQLWPQKRVSKLKVCALAFMKD